jgi:hypothetical protein
VGLEETETARTFSEDEQHHHALLPNGAATWIMHAMRGVQFPGAQVSLRTTGSTIYAPSTVGAPSEQQEHSTLRATGCI